MRAKTAKMPAKTDLAPSSENILPRGDSTIFSSMVDSLNQQIVQQEKCIENLQRNLEICNEKIKLLRSELEFADRQTGDELLTDPTIGGPTLQELSENTLLTPPVKTRKMNAKAIQIFRNLKDVAEKHRESIASIFGHLSCEENSEVQDILGEIADMVAQEKGVGKAVKVILSDEIFQKFVESMTVPDWVLLYFKLSARLPDEAWQMLLNLTRLGNTGVSLFCYFLVLTLSCRLIFIVKLILIHIKQSYNTIQCVYKSGFSELI